MKLVSKKRWASDGWQITSNKDEKYDMKLFLGTVTKDDMTGNLLVIGNLYFVWKFVKKG